MPIYHLSENGQLALRAAKKILKETLNRFPLGSFNIKPVMKNSYSDKITLYSSLFRKTESNRLIDALIDQKVTDVARKRINATRETTADVIKRVRPLPIANQRQIVRSYVASQAEATYAGNCEELATSAFMRLIEDYPGKIELVYFKDLDHTFLVINRREDSEAGAWKTWGKDTIVLDPWIKKAFPASEMALVWKDNHWNVSPATFETVVKFDDSAFRPKVVFKTGG